MSLWGRGSRGRCASGLTLDTPLLKTGGSGPRGARKGSASVLGGGSASSLRGRHMVVQVPQSVPVAKRLLNIAHRNVMWHLIRVHAVHSYGEGAPKRRRVGHECSETRQRVFRNGTFAYSMKQPCEPGTISDGGLIPFVVPASPRVFCGPVPVPGRWSRGTVNVWHGLCIACPLIPRENSACVCG